MENDKIIITDLENSEQNSKRIDDIVDFHIRCHAFTSNRLLEQIEFLKQEIALKHQEHDNYIIQKKINYETSAKEIVLKTEKQIQEYQKILQLAREKKIKNDEKFAVEKYEIMQKLVDTENENAKLKGKMLGILQEIMIRENEIKNGIESDIKCNKDNVQLLDQKMSEETDRIRIEKRAENNEISSKLEYQKDALRKLLQNIQAKKNEIETTEKIFKEQINLKKMNLEEIEKKIEKNEQKAFNFIKKRKDINEKSQILAISIANLKQKSKKNHEKNKILQKKIKRLVNLVYNF